jgi:hypothetical protein
VLYPFIYFSLLAPGDFESGSCCASQSTRRWDLAMASMSRVIFEDFQLYRVAEISRKKVLNLVDEE